MSAVAGPRRGIALPMVILVMVALAILSSLALFDALQAWRVAILAEDGVRARAAALGAVSATFSPPNLAWLCLQPPSVITRDSVGSAGGRAEVAWRALGPGRIRAEITGFGREGARARLLILLAPDSLPALPGVPGCPTATRLAPQGLVWVLRYPVG